MPNAARAKAIGGNLPSFLLLSTAAQETLYSSTTPPYARLPPRLLFGVVLPRPNAHALIMTNYSLRCGPR